jgi:IS5 family transposase
MAALSGYRSLIESYVLEVASLFEVYEKGRTLLESKEYGAVQITEDRLIIERKNTGNVNATWIARLRLDDITENPNQWYHAENPFDWNREQKVEGLYSVLKLSDPITFNYELTKYKSLSRGAQVTKQVSSQMSLKILDKMLIDMNSFLASIGFELDPMIELDSPEI